MARIAVLLVVALLAASPAAGLAATAPAEPQQSPFQQPPGPTQNQVGEQPLPAQTPVSQQTRVSNGSIGARETALIALGIVALIGGIWFVISRDAKRVTAGRLPSADGALGEGRGGSATRAARRTRRLSSEERRRRKRGRAR
jgi:hypothetical protein